MQKLLKAFSIGICVVTMEYFLALVDFAPILCFEHGLRIPKMRLLHFGMLFEVFEYLLFSFYYAQLFGDC